MVVTVAAGLSEEVAGASTTQVAALVLLSSHQSVSPHVALGTSSHRLDDDVLREFDATRRLSELTMGGELWWLVLLLLERNSK
jgi:hypothetical protein